MGEQISRGEDGSGRSTSSRPDATLHQGSLSRATEAVQPAADADASKVPASHSGNTPAAHVVLYQPEIPQNTGNIGRTCVATAAKLWIVRPAAFSFDEKRLRRAGLDYWQHLDFSDVSGWDELTERLAGHRFFFFSKFARRTLWEARFELGDVLVFGRETSGLPRSILDPEDERSLRLPMHRHVRSLNLATTVGIALYEHQRQTRSLDK